MFRTSGARVLLFAIGVYISQFLPTLGHDCWEYFVRFPSLGKPDPTYLSNQLAAKQIFRDWLRSASSEPWVEMLTRAHAVALGGTYDVDSSLITHDVTLPILGGSVIPGSLRVTAARRLPISRDRLREILGVVEGSVAEWIEEWPERLDIEGIAEGDLPQNHLIGDGFGYPDFVHVFPPVTAIGSYLDLSGSEIKLVREGLRMIQQENSRTEILRELGRYYRTAINGHLFPRVNNSLLMSHVNVVLAELGLKEISHGILDYSAFILSEENFNKFFLSQIAAQHK